jgi:hypothetical protein
MTVMNKIREANRNALVAQACLSLMSCKWHWFQHHFSRLPLHPFAYQMIEAILDCDEHIDDFGVEFLKSIISICDKEKDRDHYDQLMQRVAELLVIRQSLLIECAEPHYFIEPTAGESKKRPDLVIRGDAQTIVIEIKAPSGLKLKPLRKPDSIQLLTRLSGDPKQLEESFGTTIVLPRDNAVKDFLISADEKFASFKSEADCFTLLVIVWDDFIQEVITAIAHEQSGLLTSNSFARNQDGSPREYPNIDAVIVVRHLMYLTSGAGDGDLLDRKHAFDFGDETALPNVLFSNPISNKAVPESIRKAFRAYPHNDKRILALAEYNAQEMIFWIDT